MPVFVWRLLPEFQIRTDVLLVCLERQIVIWLVEDVIEDLVDPFPEFGGRHSGVFLQRFTEMVQVQSIDVECSGHYRGKSKSLVSGCLYRWCMRPFLRRQ
jgi:hypothetical protein